jgi:ABC-type protease/lipase transport system fused ATPase/permease subunit
MKNPFEPNPESLHSYANLKTRMLKRVQAAGVHDRIFQVVQDAYENALGEESVVLSRPERQRMLSQILRQVLDDMAKKLDKNKDAA